MVFYVLVSLLLSLAYFLLIVKYLSDWKRIPLWQIPVDYVPHTALSVIIPARNEATFIRECLQSVLDNQYPDALLQIIVVDDHSTDETAALTRTFDHPSLVLLHLKDYFANRPAYTIAFKKSAIEYGISCATGELIVATDADCIADKSWLYLIASYYEKYRPAFIAAPVALTGVENAFQRFQALDFAGMMGVTGAGIIGRYNYMCNGANLAYEKKVFDEVGGFTGINKLASGDDMLLMQKIAHKYPDRIGYIKNPRAITSTLVQPDISSFFSQRLRWASKSTKYQQKITTVQLGLVLLFCCNIMASLLFSFLYSTFFYLFLFQFCIKFIVDFLFLREMAAYFHRKDLLKGYFFSQLFHIGYIFTVGLLTNILKKYYWKGRLVN